MSAGKAALDAITHPSQTLGAIEQLGRGAISQVQGAMGAQQDPVEKAKTETLVKALEDHYATAYGSVKGLKQAISADPVGVAMDASTLLGGAGAVGKVAGLGKVAEIAGRAASAIDPVANAVRAATLPVRAISNPVTRAVSAAATGVPAKLYQVVKAAGSTGDPVLRQAYLDAARGQASATDYLTRAQNAIRAVKQNMSDEYLAKKGAMASAPVASTNTTQSLADAYAKAQLGARVGSVPQAAVAAIDEARQMVDDVMGTPGRATLQNVDALKQQLWDLKDFHRGVAGPYLDSIYHGVRSDLMAADDEYTKLMEQYQLGLSDVKNIASTVGVSGKSPAAGAALAKSLRSLKTTNGKDVLDQISQYDPTIPYMLAGHAVNHLGSGLWHAMGDTAAAGIAGGALFHPIGALAGAPALVAGLAVSSPKINAGLHYLSGAAPRIGQAAVPVGRGAYYAGRASEENAPSPPTDTASPDADATWRKMVSQESGGHQFDTSGHVTTSKKGAIGTAQLMPRTGPEAAALAGEDWDLDRAKTDADYNVKLGRAYFDALLSRFGDPALAAAAYDAGPDRVQNALKTAERTGSSWLDHLPGETRDYVANVAGVRGHFASGGAVGDTRERLVRQLMSRAQQAKRVSAKVTEPLLDIPDNTIARALEVAQRAI